MPRKKVVKKSPFNRKAKKYFAIVEPVVIKKKRVKIPLGEIIIIDSHKRDWLDKFKEAIKDI